MNRILLSLFSILFSVYTLAQGTAEDYQRAESVKTRYQNKVYNAPVTFQWIKGQHSFWYLNQTPAGKVFYLVNADKRSQAIAFDHAKLSNSVSAILHKRIDATALPFQWIDFSADQKSITFQIDSAKLNYDIRSGRCKVIEVIRPETRNGYWGDHFDEKGNKPVKSPDSLWVAFIRDNNVYIRNRKTSEEHPLSLDGNGGNFYSSYIQWSPDSKKLMAYRVTPGETRLIYFVESSPKDQLQPKLHSREYLKPGDALPHKQPQLFLIDERKHVPIADDQFKNQFFLEEIKWASDSRSFTFEFNERGHQRYQVFQVQVPTGELKVIVDERSKTFIDYSGKRFRHDLINGKELIWASERDGWNHLYLYSTGTGEVINQITKGSWVMRSVVHVDEEKRQIIFEVLGMDTDQDPYQSQYCVINFDGTGLRRLTRSNADHNVTFSEDYKYFVDHQSRPDLPPIVKLFETETASEKMVVQQADISALEKEGWRMPEVFSAKGRDGATDIWGIVIRPSNFSPGKKYPVVEMVYAGPQSFYVPKGFNSGYFSLHALAELGFIVVQVDGMGTSWRSKAFHDVCYKNLKDAGFQDRIAWIKALAAKYPYIDIDNVGIYGGSAGGQNAASAVMLHSDFYRAAVASCGSHDNRVDKIWWNEQWMGYPVGPEYAASSNVVNAPKLNGKLLLIVGELDDNVDPASTLQVADALIKSKKDFELVVVPGMGHSGGGEFGERKRRDFFVKHLLHVEPPGWSDSYPEKPIFRQNSKELRSYGRQIKSDK
jgi:dipeptidyl aminopeptidase/acylaminoacyl peptidase